MTQFFARKLNKKGFTLAELLIVVAIIAILIAIAVPIYTSALKDAQIKVNLANARTLKGAAVSYILSHWTDSDGTGDGTTKYSDGSKQGGSKQKGWLAIGTFDNNGDITNMHVGVLTADVSSPAGKYFVTKTSTPVESITDLLKGGTLSAFEAINSSATPSTGAAANPNTVCVVIGEADVANAG